MTIVLEEELFLTNKEKKIGLELEYMRLTSLTVSDNNNETFSRKNKIELINFDQKKNTIELKYTDDLIHNTNIHLEIVAFLKVNGKIDKDDLLNIINSDKVDDLAYPLLSEATHIIAFITSKTDSIPLIIPPTFDKFYEDENDD